MNAQRTRATLTHEIAKLRDLYNQADELFVKLPEADVELDYDLVCVQLDDTEELDNVRGLGYHWQRSDLDVLFFTCVEKPLLAANVRNRRLLGKDEEL